MPERAFTPASPAARARAALEIARARLKLLGPPADANGEPIAYPPAVLERRARLEATIAELEADVDEQLRLDDSDFA